jgi:hypothetical protein
MLDATPIVLEILRDALTVDVTTDIPKDRPPRLVLVDLTGDQSDEFILRPRYALTCWGSSDKDAHGIAISAVEALQEAALDHPLLSSCDLETMSREEWSRNGQSRYMAEVTLIINNE